MPVHPFVTIKRIPMDQSVSFALTLYLLDSDGLMLSLESAVSHFDYLSARVSRGEISFLRFVTEGGASSDAFGNVNTGFMEFPVPSRAN